MLFEQSFTKTTKQTYFLALVFRKNDRNVPDDVYSVIKTTLIGSDEVASFFGSFTQ